MMPLYNIHPILIHFPIALLTAALAGEALSLLLKDEKWSWLVPAAEWTLWVGTLSAWAALGAGLLAEATAPHVPAALETLEEHEALGFWTAGLFTALSLARFFARRSWRGLAEKWRWGFVAGWMGAAGVLAATAYHGGELVFRYGMGVR